ncbi:hypothetical protein HKCCE2091_07620 [Rhodobacterales bacterium HKCCE2091]|nr:hypothetical protein [Rhodobacterales bacterium HKCCE2091]
MFGLFKISRHADLAQRMAKTLGRDPIGSVAAAEHTAQRWRSAVLSCTRCDRACDCEAWLDSHPTAEVAPGYCRNADFLARMPKSEPAA